MLPAPLLIIPSIAMLLVEKTPFLTNYPRLSLPVNAFFCCVSFVFGLPLAIALFPQVSKIPASQLEPEFHGLIDGSGKQVSQLMYNKGL